MKKAVQKIRTLFLGCVLVLGTILPVSYGSAERALADTATTFTFSDDGIKASDEAAEGFTVSGTTLTIEKGGNYVVTGSCSDGNVIVKNGTSGVNLTLSDLTLSCADTAPVVCSKNTQTNIEIKGTVTLEDAVTNSTAYVSTDATDGTKDDASASEDTEKTDTEASKDSETEDDSKDTEEAKEESEEEDASENTEEDTDSEEDAESDDAEEEAADEESSEEQEEDIKDTTSDDVEDEDEPSSDDETDGEDTKEETEAKKGEAVDAVLFSDGDSKTVISGDGTLVLKACAKYGLYSKSDISISGITLDIDASKVYAASGGTAKGDGIHVDGSLTMESGKATILASGSGIYCENVPNFGTMDGDNEDLTVSVSDSYDGIVGNAVNIYCGTFTVNADNNGIEGKGSETVSVYGGKITVNAGMDNGGAGDAFLSNGRICIYGGEVLAFSGENGQPFHAVGIGNDDDEESFCIYGGTIFGVGSSESVTEPSEDSEDWVSFGYTEEGAVITNLDYTKGLVLKDGETSYDVGAKSVSISASDELSIVNEETLYTATAIHPANYVLYSGDMGEFHKEYMLTYSANGGKGRMDAQTGDSLTVAENNYTYEGFTFVEWNTKKSGAGDSYQPKDTIEILQNTMLYAIWEKNAEVNTDTKKETTNKETDDIEDNGNKKSGNTENTSSGSNTTTTNTTTNTTNTSTTTSGTSGSSTGTSSGNTIRDSVYNNRFIVYINASITVSIFCNFKFVGVILFVRLIVGCHQFFYAPIFKHANKKSPEL